MTSCPFALAVVPFALLSLGASVLAQPGGGGPPPAQVELSPVTQAEVVSDIELVAATRARRASILGAAIAGRVREVLHREGSTIEAGELLIELDDVQQRQRVEQAKAQVESLQQQYNELRAGTRQEQIEAARARVAEMDAMFGMWEAEMQRLSSIGRQATSTKEVSDARAELEAARARRAEAGAELAEAEAGPRTEEIARAAADLRAAQAELTRLQDLLDKTHVTAPYDGVVSALHVEVGQWVREGDPIIDVLELKPILVRVGVPERYVAAIRDRHQQARQSQDEFTVPVVVEPLQPEPITGKLIRVIPQADLAARTYPVEIELANDDRRILPGMFSRVNLPAGPRVQAVLVPKDAVVRKGSQTLVYVAQPPADGQQMPTARPVNVQVVAASGSLVAIQGPITPDMRVVSRGNENLIPGQTLVVLAGAS